jgi:hypothetical protein
MPPVSDNVGLGRFEFVENGEVAFANYELSSEQITIP